MSYDEKYEKNLKEHFGEDAVELKKQMVADKHFAEINGIKNHRKIKSSKGRYPSNRQPPKKKRKKK